MRSAILVFTAGAAWLQTQPTIPDPTSFAACVATAIVVCVILRGLARKLIASVLLGVCWAALLTHSALDDALQLAEEGREIAVTGVVASLPHRFDGGVRFQFDVAHVDTSGATVPANIILSWYSASAADPAFVQPGERWRLVVRLQRPHGNANLDGFDYEAWLLEQGVRATCYVRPAGAHNARLAAWTPDASYAVERERGWLRSRTLTVLDGKSYVA